MTSPASEAPRQPNDPRAHHDELLLMRAIDRLTFSGAGAADLPVPPPIALDRALLAVDDSEESDVALQWAKALQETFGLHVTVVCVAPPPYEFADGIPGWAVSPAEAHSAAVDHARAAAHRAARRLERADVLCPVGSTVREITRAAHMARADLVITGSHQRGALGRLLLGSVADGVKNHVDATILIARAPPARKGVLIAVDGSPPSRKAACFGARLAQRWGVRATVTHVLPPWSESVALDRDALGATARELEAMGPIPNVGYALDLGPPAERIVEAAARDGCDLIVMGSRGLGAFGSLVAGSVSSRVSHLAQASVLLIKDGALEMQ